MEKYDETLAVINKMAMVKMHMNSHKGAIEDCNVDTLMGLMVQEVDELRESIDGSGNALHVIEEAADVMNFLVAIVHQQIEEYRSRK